MALVLTFQLLLGCFGPKYKLFHLKQICLRWWPTISSRNQSHVVLPVVPLVIKGMITDTIRLKSQGDMN